MPASIERVAVEAEPDDRLCRAKPSGRRAERVARSCRSTATRVPAPLEASASSLPTRPQPTTTTCTGCSLLTPEPATGVPVLICAGFESLTAVDERRMTRSALGHGGMASCAAGRSWPGRSEDPTTWPFVKRVLVGRPLATTELEHERISKTDRARGVLLRRISSTAYATEEILFVVAVGRHRASRSGSTR